ncbi:MAG: hypothetical protein AAFS01_00200 [Pseudomonadota bacterium]
MARHPTLHRSFDRSEHVPARIDLDQDRFIFMPPVETDPIIDEGVVAGTWSFFASKMIVSRMQDHVIETSDGDLHLLLNLGPNKGLRLITSTDNGQTWSLSADLPDANLVSTADIRMVEGTDRAVLVYTTGTDEIVYIDLMYDTDANAWTALNLQTVASDVDEATALNPTIAIAASGRLYVGYADGGDFGVTVTVHWSDDLGQSWSSARYFDSDALVGSARVLTTPDTFGTLYATTEDIVWITYNVRAGDWDTETVLSPGSLGYYASHFSTTTMGGDIFLVNADPDLTLSFVIYDGDAGGWGAAMTIPEVTAPVSSAQISAETDGDLYITYDNVDTLELVVLESADGGQTWDELATLDAPKILIDEPMRFEAPEQFDDELIIFQQIGFPGIDAVSGLYYYVIDTDAETVTHEGFLEGAETFFDITSHLQNIDFA